MHDVNYSRKRFAFMFPMSQYSTRHGPAPPFCFPSSILFYFLPFTLHLLLREIPWRKCSLCVLIICWLLALPEKSHVRDPQKQSGASESIWLRSDRAGVGRRALQELRDSRVNGDLEESLSKKIIVTKNPQVLIACIMKPLLSRRGA